MSMSAGERRTFRLFLNANLELEIELMLMNLVPGADALVVELAEAAHHAVGDVGAAGEQGLPAVRPDDPSGVEVHKVDLQGKERE